MEEQTNPGENSHQEVVDDVAGEEEGVDEASVLVSECLGGDGGLVLCVITESNLNENLASPASNKYRGRSSK